VSLRSIALGALVFALAIGTGLGFRWLSKAELGEGCDIDGDCRDSGAICLQTYEERTCTLRCTDDADCREGELCREADLHDDQGPTDTAHLVCTTPAPTLDTFRNLSD